MYSEIKVCGVRVLRSHTQAFICKWLEGISFLFFCLKFMYFRVRVYLEKSFHCQSSASRDHHCPRTTVHELLRATYIQVGICIDTLYESATCSSNSYLRASLSSLSHVMHSPALPSQQSRRPLPRQQFPQVRASRLIPISSLRC